MEVVRDDLEAMSRGAKIALSTFVACRHPVESCRHNGLPLPPNSISIMGQAQKLKQLRHANLCSFLDCQRGKGGRIVCASEYYEHSFKNFNEDGEKTLFRIGCQIARAFEYLEREGIVHTNLEWKNVLLTERDSRVKLFDYGLGYMTNYGAYVSFPVFVNPRSTAPEVFAHDKDPRQLTRSQLLDPNSDGNEDADQDSIVFIESAPPPPPSYCTSKCSVWSLGILLLGKALNVPEFWPNLNVAQCIRRVLNVAIASSCNNGKNKSAAERISKEHNLLEKYLSLPEDLKALIEDCLVVDVRARPSPRELMTKCDISVPDFYENLFTFPTLNLRCKDLDLDDVNDDDAENDHRHPDSIRALTIQEVLYLWQLAGGDYHSELRKHGLVVNMPPMLRLPSLVVSGSSSPLSHEHHRMMGRSKDKSCLYDSSIVTLDLSQLVQCLESLTADDIYPVLSSLQPVDGSSVDEGGCSNGLLSDETSSLPLVIRERDVRYQFGRIVLYRKLLQSYPYQRPMIWKEARVDSLPLYRCYIWAALLGIDHDVQSVYDEIDKETLTPTDRQIEVDIPRCHQYNQLLASPEGHRKFKRVLKAWVVTNPQYVYWQGLDSLCAPFLLLNFNDEALAFACLSAFIPKYLYGMFRKNNANVIQEYLAKFSHVQAFHDPVLFNHLDGIGFIPDLYAIPWVLTMFSHVFPLHNIFHLWDKLLLGNSSFPLCVALAILYQLRDRLLNSEFNDCILLFSDLPTIDIEKCVEDSIHIFCSTPKSLTFRKFGSPDPTPSNGKNARRHDNLPYDHHDLTLNSISLTQQKTEKVPRISGEETLILLGLAKVLVKRHAESGPVMKTIKSKVVVIDVRQPSEFKLGALPGSINFPFFHDDEASANFSNLIQERIHKEMISRKVVCVAGSKFQPESAVKFASILLTQLSFPRVCVLHNGVEIFKPLPGVLFVPNV